MAATPITIDLPVLNQGINIDIESIAPLHGFDADSYDVANMTITATVQSPTDQQCRLVLAAAEEVGTSAFARVVSASEAHFKDVQRFRRVYKSEAPTLRPVLDKAGIPLNPDVSEQRQLEALRAGFRIADVKIPAGQQVLRIQASQKLDPVDGDPRSYRFVMYAPQLSFVPVGNVRLGVTVVFPLDFSPTIDPPSVEALPNQPSLNAVGGAETPLGQQKAYGWAFYADPKVTISYRYA